MKKLFDFKMAGSVLLMLAISLSSCKQDLTVQPNPSVEEIQKEPNEKVESLNLEGLDVQNGMLVFDSYDAMNKVREQFKKTNFASYKAWCESKGFRSLTIVQDELFKEYEAPKTTAEMDLFKQKNADFLIFNEDGGIDMKNPILSFHNILNTEDMFKIKKTLYKLDAKGEIFVIDGDINKMQSAYISRKEIPGVSIFPIDLLKTRAACGMENNSGWVSGDSGRRAIVSGNLFWFFFDPYGDGLYRNVRGEFIVQSRAQKRTFRIWNDYTTEQTLNYDIVIQWITPFPTSDPRRLNREEWYNGTLGPLVTNSLSFSDKFYEAFDIPTQIFDNTVRPKFADLKLTYSNRGGVNIDWFCD